MSVLVRGWQGFRLHKEHLSLGFAPEIGGRIVSVLYKGVELLFVQEAHEGESFTFAAGTDLRKEKNRLGFRLWGGDKTWVAPQSAWWEAIPPLELDASPYQCEVKENRVVMTSPICHETGLQIVRRVELLSGDRVIIEQEFYNPGSTEILRGIWDVTQVLRPFEVVFSVPKTEVKAYPTEGNSVEIKDLVVKEVEGKSIITCHEPIHFKYGALYAPGVILLKRENLLWKRIFYADPTLPYAHGASAEVYNSPDYPYLEVEVHAPLVLVLPGQKVSHQIEWQFSM